jgi:hypothetical protein
LRLFELLFPVLFTPEVIRQAKKDLGTYGPDFSATATCWGDAPEAIGAPPWVRILNPCRPRCGQAAKVEAYAARICGRDAAMRRAISSAVGFSRSFPP